MRAFLREMVKDQVSRQFDSEILDVGFVCTLVRIIGLPDAAGRSTRSWHLN